MFQELKKINSRPRPFEFYTAGELWTNEHTAKQMLKYHLNDSVEASSRDRRFINRSIEWIASRFKVDKNSSIADFGCGPGLYTTRLAQKGAKVTGIDFSANSITYAREKSSQKGLEIKYELANYLDFDTEEKFDLITMIMCDFCALSPDQRKSMLSKFRTFLKPGGALLLDVYSLNRFHKIEESASYEFNQLNGFWSPDEYYGFVNTFKYEKEHVTLDKYTIIEKNQSRVVYNWLQYFSENLLRIEFEENALAVESFYSDVCGNELTPDSMEIAIVAKKA